MIAGDIEKYVSIFGEQYRKLIVDSLDWLEERRKRKSLECCGFYMI